MDFRGVLTTDSFLASSSSSSSSLSTTNDAFSEHNKAPLFASSCLKHTRSTADLEPTRDFGFPKMPRTEMMKMRHDQHSKYSSYYTPASGSLFPGGTQMLSFSSSGKQSASLLSTDAALPYHLHHHSSQSSLQPSYFRNGGN